MSISDKTIAKATKWSTLTEIVAKLAMPVSSMILARLLVPSAYGIVASVNMVLTFCELFADAGFSKYIVQHETTSEEELDQIISVSFWTNLVATLAIWLFISLFAKPISMLVGCPGKELAVIVACVNLPIHGFSSIMNAKLKRIMDFKSLFVLRIITLLVPFVVTIPIAYITHSYWAMIIGTIAGNTTHVIAMMIKLRWKPSRYFSFAKLKEMFSFSAWSMLESFLVWLINWGDIFIVTQLLTQEYLGIYKTSMNMVGQLTGIVSASIVPVFLSTMSKLQGDLPSFRNMFYKFSTAAGLILVPMGVGMYLYRDLMCSVSLGADWMEGATLMGIWGLVNCIAVLFNSFNGHVLIAMGKPKVSVVIQLVQIAAIMPAVYFSAQTSFSCLSYTRALIRVFGMIVYSIAVWKMYRISCLTTLKQLIPTLIATAVMATCAYVFLSLNLNDALLLGSVVVCIAVYFGVLILFPNTRKNLKPMLTGLLRRS